MWIKSLTDNTWINLNHVTHFTVRHSFGQLHAYTVDAYLDASEQGLTTPRAGLTQDQTSIWVYEGSEKQCVRFIKRKLRWQTIYQWLGYLVAGGIGAVLTYFLTKLS